MLYYVLAFISGIFVKWVDWIEDEQKGKSLLKYPLAVIYGVLIGYLISAASFSEIFLAALVAQVFARKIDTVAHILGFVVAMMSLLFFGFPEITIPFFGYFLILAFIDEQNFGERYKFITKYRPVLKLGSLLAILWGRWDFFIAVLLFDAGYMLYQKFKEKEDYLIFFKKEKPVEA